jgi:DNA invertase Pin-like site-specific DNA recombinase
MTKAPIVDIYCRTADGGPEAQSKLDTQEAVCRAYCEEHDLTVGLVHAESASGATFGDREQLRLLRNRYCDRLIQGVVMTDLHRLSRSHVDLAHLINEMRTAEVTLYYVNDTAITSTLMSSVMEFVSETERE